MSSQSLKPKPVRGPLQPHAPANVGVVVAAPQIITESAQASMHPETAFWGLEGLKVHDLSALRFTKGAPRLQGGAADVEQATYVCEGNPPVVVAVKMVRMGGQSDRRRLRAFFNELRVTSGLDHPNIIKLVGFAEDDRAGIAWLLFPWEANGNLRDFLSRGLWDLPERVALIQDVAAGLDYIHRQQPPICHGDLKS
ncbi:hypothetical protein FRC00_003157, partial [Tulasnella sp. 408]